MTILERETAIGVFSGKAPAEAALNELHAAGFAAEQLGFAALDHRESERLALPTPPSEFNSVPETAKGAMSGGLIGGIAGATVSLLIPGFGTALASGILFATLGAAAMGAVAGGFVGSLTVMGVPEEEAKHYQDMLTSGHTIVTVRAPGHYEEALNILRKHGAENSAVGESIIADADNAESPRGPTPPTSAGPAMPAIAALAEPPPPSAASEHTRDASAPIAEPDAADDATETVKIRRPGIATAQHATPEHKEVPVEETAAQGHKAE